MAESGKLLTNSSLLYSNDEIIVIKNRGKVRTLTKLCVSCQDLHLCVFGNTIVQIHNEFCAPQVGNDFGRCCECTRTLDGSCGVDQAALGADLRVQLAVCTRKRGFEMPFLIMQWDILLGDRSSRNAIESAGDERSERAGNTRPLAK